MSVYQDFSAATHAVKCSHVVLLTNITNRLLKGKFIFTLRFKNK